IDSMPPATTISDSPSSTACAASATAFRPEPQTLLMVIAATRGWQPPFGAANGFGHDFGSEFGGGESGKATLKFADGRADGGNNHGSFGVHGGPPNRTTEERRTSL